MTAHVFHLLNAPRYFLTVLSARLCKTVLGSLLARAFSSGSSSSSNSFQDPCARIPKECTYTHTAGFVNALSWHQYRQSRSYSGATRTGHHLVSSEILRLPSGFIYWLLELYCANISSHQVIHTSPRLYIPVLQTATDNFALPGHTFQSSRL